MGAEIPASLLTVVAVYFVSTVYLLAVAAIAARSPRPDAAPEGLFFVLVVPALNEELVIGNTVRHLLGLAGDNYLVLVIDDGSNDGTASVVRRFPPEKVRLASRLRPFARQGKGEALNYAYRAILTSELPHVYGVDNIILAVMDADGQVDPRMLKAVAPYFGDAQTGAVQIGVRMLNANANIWTRWQQYEFVTFNWIFSRARESLGSVGLGGNGQFVRMSALATLEGKPWTECLTEDLDIGLRLMLGGWRNRYCHDVCVYQQAVTEPKRLVRQRSRWFQGHLSCWRHIPAVLVSDWPSYRKADVLNYLLAPGLVLPMGLVSLLTLPLMFIPGLLPWAPSLDIFNPANAVQWYVLSMGAAPLFAVAMWRSKQSGLLSSLLWAHIFLLGSYIWLIAGMMAVKRMATGKAGWLKTARTQLQGAEALPALSGATAGRWLAGQNENSWNEETRTLLPLRANNFTPRAADEPKRGYLSAAPGANHARVSAAVALAQAEAHLHSLAQTVQLAATAWSAPADSLQEATTDPDIRPDAPASNDEPRQLAS